MLTRIEIDGFKSFHNFAVDIRPFQVFIGPNGVGKTNLFDAITLLANMAGDNMLEDAFRHNRGELSELFTLFPDGRRARSMSFAAEMLLDKTFIDDSGKPDDLTTTRLRYEVTIEARIEGGRDRVYVAKEALLPIKDSDDKWAKEILPTKTRKNWALREKRPPFIATTTEENGKATIHRNQDGLAGGRESVMVGSIDRTLLSSANAARYPTIHAARQEMQQWRFLQLNPYTLRTPADVNGKDTLLPDGSNLANVLARLGKGKDGLAAVTRDMKAFNSNIANISVNPVIDRDELLIEIETQDKSKFSSRVLSDGTLRLLALVSMKSDPQHKGLLCFEEPENGVQPLRLKQIMDVLFSLSVDVTSERITPEGGPLRQVLINTHSPGLLAMVPTDSVLYVHMKAEEKGHTTRTVPVRAELIRDEEERYYTWEQVGQYLDADALNRKREELGL